MKRTFKFGWILAALMSVAPGMMAQRVRGPRAQARPMRQAQRQVQRQENKPGVRGAMGLPPKWVEKLQKMSPQEQERFMNNNRKFQSLPPQRQEQIRRQLQKWDQLSPEERDRLWHNQQVFARLTPEERQDVVQNLAPRWKALPQERKQLLTGRMHVLAGMTPEQRQQALQDPEFMRGLSADEQDLLRRMTNLRLGPPDGQ